jgi:parallel beta-helix repeat protein
VDFLGKAITVRGVATSAGVPIIENPGDFAVSVCNGEEPNSILENFVIKNSFIALFIAGNSPTINNLTVVNNKYGITAYGGSDPDISNCIFWNNTDDDLSGCQAHYSWIQDELEPPPLEGIVSHWRLDEGSGTIAHDSVGSNHGTIYEATWTDGVLGGALDFDGVSDYIDVPDSESLRFTQNDSFSISCWAMPVVGDGGRIVCKMRKTSATGVFGYETLWQPTLSAFEFSAESSRRGYTPVRTSNGSAPAGNWYHFTAVYSNKSITLYLNGQPAGAGTFAYNAGSTTPDKNLSIGVRSYDSKMENYFKGRIDDVRIYGRALSSPEVEQLYQVGSGGAGFSADPLFADPNHGDYHLRSNRGRYWPAHNVWVLDNVTSPCVDGGDPTDDPSGEPMPNGGRIDMGAYGRTPYASMSEWPIAADVNRDGVVDLADLAIFCNEWLSALPWAE